MWEDFLTFADLAAIEPGDEPIPLWMGICIPSRRQFDEMEKCLTEELVRVLLGESKC